jgi:hypothetical protein
VIDFAQHDHDELSIMRRNRLPAWTCWIDVKQEATGDVLRISLVTGLTKDDAWWAGRDAMFSRDDVIDYRVRPDTGCSISLH